MLSARLSKILEKIPSCDILADIGTDHGYIPLEAIKSNKCKKAIASDVSKGSLEKAINQVNLSNLNLVIDTRLGSGLKVLKEDETDVLIIAGMGGILIKEILKDDYDKKFKVKTPTMIFQPVQFPESLRKYLIENNFEIIDEDLVEDDKIIYNIIISKKGLGEKTDTWNDMDFEFGKINIEKKHPLLLKLLDRKINEQEKIIQKLKDAEGENISSRLEEVETLLYKFKELRKCCFQK